MWWTRNRHIKCSHSVYLPAELISSPGSTLFQSALHCPVVTKWLGIVCIKYLQGTLKILFCLTRKKTSNGRRFSLYQYLSHNIHTALEPAWFFSRDMVYTGICKNMLFPIHSARHFGRVCARHTTPKLPPRNIEMGNLTLWGSTLSSSSKSGVQKRGKLWLHLPNLAVAKGITFGNVTQYL